MRNIALQLEYDGTRLVGSQFQTNGRTVQGELEAAWHRLTGEPTRWNFAGRTDAGVHAQGQVANARTLTRHETATVQRALNALLPDDISVRHAWDVPYEFHARYSAIRRDYRYLLLLERWRSPLLRHRAVHIDDELDVAAMARAVKVLEGVHDLDDRRNLAAGGPSKARRRGCGADPCKLRSGPSGTDCATTWIISDVGNVS
jgi:tRNA pseudouridine38-40 synthase